MKLTYERISSILNSKFNIIEGEQKHYFVDKTNKVVATFDNNLNTITMFYDFPDHSREIWNHDGKVAIIFAKDFTVNGNLCDILCIDGLCGASNDFILYKNYYIEIMNNSEMRYLFEKKKTLQKLFATLSYKKRISVLEKFTGANIEGIQLFPDGEDYALGNCGNLSSENGIANFYICGVIKVKDMVVNRKENGYEYKYYRF